MRCIDLYWKRAEARTGWRPKPVLGSILNAVWESSGVGFFRPIHDPLGRQYMCVSQSCLSMYMFDDQLPQKLVDAHLWINGNSSDVGCSNRSSKYERGIRADVLITQPVEELWKNRKYDWISYVSWTYLGLRSGVFRTYPGHPSTRDYDPTKRGWYQTAVANSHITVLSTPYMDAAGVGKIITISQAIYEGMDRVTMTACSAKYGHGPFGGGCECQSNDDCLSKKCYEAMAPEPPGFSGSHRCATERVEGVTSLDIMYNTFHEKTMDLTESSDLNKPRGCNERYTCPDGEPGCSTKCYLFNSKAQLVVDPDFPASNAMDDSKYAGVTLGRKEGEVMRSLIYKDGLIIREEKIVFQGVCQTSPKSPKVTLEGIESTPEEKDNKYRNRGPIPMFVNDFGCIQDKISYKVNITKVPEGGMLIGNVSGPCMSGIYYVKGLPSTNLYLLVIENYKRYDGTLSFDLNCRITRSVVDSGAYKVTNGTCAQADKKGELTLKDKGSCPALRAEMNTTCVYSGDSALQRTLLSLIFWIFVRM